MFVCLFHLLASFLCLFATCVASFSMLSSWITRGVVRSRLECEFFEPRLVQLWGHVDVGAGFHVTFPQHAAQLFEAITSACSWRCTRCRRMSILSGRGRRQVFRNLWNRGGLLQHGFRALLQLPDGGLLRVQKISMLAQRGLNHFLRAGCGSHAHLKPVQFMLDLLDGSLELLHLLGQLWDQAQSMHFFGIRLWLSQQRHRWLEHRQSEPFESFHALMESIGSKSQPVDLYCKYSSISLARR